MAIPVQETKILLSYFHVAYFMSIKMFLYAYAPEITKIVNPLFKDTPSFNLLKSQPVKEFPWWYCSSLHQNALKNEGTSSFLQLLAEKRLAVAALREPFRLG